MKRPKLKLKTQYGNEISALNAAYQKSADQVRQQVNALRLQGQKQEAQVRADYYAKLAQMSLQLQRAEAAAKAQAAKTASGSRKYIGCIQWAKEEKRTGAGCTIQEQFS